MISVIIPTYNEESTIEGLLRQLRAQGNGCEILVADGASTDRTVALAERTARVLVSEPNRGLQLNRAAREARGDVLLFLHADVRPPTGVLAALERVMADPAVVGGSFSLEFVGDGLPARVFTLIDRWRRPFGIFYGDAGLFVRRSVFERLGGFREWPLLEDYDFARRLVKAGRTVCLPQRLAVSSRRWKAGAEGRGRLWRTMTAWFFIQVFFLLRVPPRWLARWYPPVREGQSRSDSEGL
ncbi:MAG: TIGR04283 family arsenosugar biosynthesis glycosyltransferase [Terriglobia bacterium]